MDAQTCSWVLERLWEAVTVRNIPLRLAVPPIILFTRGVPTRFLASSSSDQRLASVAFDDQLGHDASAHAAVSISEDSLAGVVRTRIQCFARQALQFLVDAGFATDDAPLNVGYADGSLDCIPMKEFLAICEHGEWRAKVAFVLPAVPPRSLVTGAFVRTVDIAGTRNRETTAPSDEAISAVGPTFSQALTMAMVKPQSVDPHDNLFDSASTYRAGPGKAGAPIMIIDQGQADALAADIAAAIDQSFVLPVPVHETMGSATTASATPAPSAGPAGSRSTLRVGCFVGRFCKTAAGSAIFTLPVLTLTRDVGESLSSKLASGKKKPKPLSTLPSYLRKDTRVLDLLELTGAEAKKEALGEADRAAGAAHGELQQLVDAALGSGVPLVEVWAHFDPEGRDVLEPAVFRERLSLLGITLHDLPFAALLARIPARVSVDDRDPALQATGKRDPHPAKRFGPAEFFAFLKRDPSRQFEAAPSMAQPARQGSATGAALGITGAASGTVVNSHGSVGAGSGVTLVGASTFEQGTAAFPTAASAPPDAYAEAQAAYKALASKLSSALDTATAAGAAYTGASALKRIVPSSHHASIAGDATAGTLTRVNVPAESYSKSASSILASPDDVFEARALPDSFFAYRRLACEGGPGAAARLPVDARPAVVAAQRQLQALSSPSRPGTSPDGVLRRGSVVTSGGATAAAPASLDRLVAAYSQPFKETRLASAAAASSLSERSSNSAVGPAAAASAGGSSTTARVRRRSSGAGTRRRRASSSANGQALAAAQSESSLRLAYNLPRVVPLAKPPSLLPPRARRPSAAATRDPQFGWHAGGDSQRSLGTGSYGRDSTEAGFAAGGSAFDAATVRLTTPEEGGGAYQDDGNGYTVGNQQLLHLLSSSDDGIVTPALSTFQGGHTPRDRGPGGGYGGGWAQSTVSSDGSGGGWGHGQNPDGPATFPAAGHGPSHGLWDSTSSPYLTSVDGRVRGGLFDPESIRQLGVPQTQSEQGAAAEGLPGGGGGALSGASSYAPFDDGIDDRFLVPGALPALNSNGQPCAFSYDESPTQAAHADAAREEGRARVVAELERRGIPTAGCTELELLERLEVAIDDETARASLLSERLRMQSQQRRRSSVQLPADLAGVGGPLGSPSGASSSARQGEGSDAFAGGSTSGPLASVHAPKPPAPEDPAVLEQRRRERRAMGAEDDRSRLVETWATAIVALGQGSGDLAAAIGSLSGVLQADEVALLTLAVERASERRGALHGAAGATSSKTPEQGAPHGSDAPASAAAALADGSDDYDSAAVVENVATEVRRTNAAKFAALRAKATAETLILRGEEHGYTLDLSPAGLASVPPVVRRLCAHVSDLRARRVSAERAFRKAAVKLRRQQMELVRHRVSIDVVDRATRAAARDRGDIRAALRKAGHTDAEATAHHQYRVAEAEVAQLQSKRSLDAALADGVSCEMGIQMITTAGYAASFAYVLRRCEEKEALLRDARAALAKTVSETRDAARGTKDAQERKAFKALRLTAHLANARAQVEELRSERLRLRHVTARYVDTSVLAPTGRGSTSDSAPLQRVEAEALRLWLGDEILKQKLEVADAAGQLDELTREVETLQGSYTSSHEAVLLLSGSLRSVVELIQATPPRCDVEAMLRRLFDVGSVIKQVQRSGAARAAKGEQQAVDMSDVFGTSGSGASGSAELDDEEHDPLDEGVQAAGGAPGGVSGAATRFISRRDATLAWRSRQIARDCEVDTALSHIISAAGGDARVHGELGISLERVTAPQSWYMSATRTLAIADGTVSPAQQPQQALEASALSGGPLVGAAAALAQYNGGGVTATAPSSQPSSMTLHALAGTGYATSSTLEAGMHAVVGAPSEPSVSAFPFVHAPPPNTPGLGLGAFFGVGGGLGSSLASSLSMSGLPYASLLSGSGGLGATGASTGAESIGLPITFPLRAGLQTSHGDRRLWSAQTSGTADGGAAAGAQQQQPNRWSRAVGTALSSRRGSRGAGRSAGALVPGGGAAWPALIPWAGGGSGILASGDESLYRVSTDCKLGVLVRWLAASERSLEQKQWVALDRRLHPKRYARLSAEDEKAYAIDPAYGCTVPRHTLVRIAGLPASPLQAVAHMRDASESRLHALIAKYTHGQGEEVERLRDQESGARGVAMAAVARGYIARVKPAHLRSAEEEDWVLLDALVRPQLYVPRPYSAQPTSSAGLSRSSRDRDGPMSPQAAASASPAATAAGVGQGGWFPHASGASDEREGDVDDDAGPGDASISLQASRKGLGGFGGYVRRTLAKLLDYDKRRSKASAESLQSLRADAEAAKTAKRNSRSGSAGRRRPTSAGPGGRPSSRQQSQADARAASAPPRKSPRPVNGIAAIGEFQRTGPHVRPPPGSLATGYTRDQLLSIMASRPVDLPFDRDRCAQLLLRAYGSDGGESLYRAALSHVTPVVNDISELADAYEAMRKDAADSGQVDYTPELARAYSNGDASNVAAVVLQSVQCGVLVRSKASAEVLTVRDAPLRPGLTADHSFEIPSRLADIVAYGPRSVTAVGPASASGSNAAAPATATLPPSEPRPSASGSGTSVGAGVGAVPTWSHMAADYAFGSSSSALTGLAPGAGAASSAAGSPPLAGTAPGVPASASYESPSQAEADIYARSSASAPPVLTTPSEVETGSPGAAAVAVDINVTILFHGAFVDKSYVLGKLTAALYREPFAPDGQPPVLVGTGAVQVSAEIPGAQVPTQKPPPVSAQIEGVPAVKPSAAVRAALARPDCLSTEALARSVALHGDTAPMVIDDAGVVLGWARDEDEEELLRAEQKQQQQGGYDDDGGYISDPEDYARGRTRGSGGTAGSSMPWRRAPTAAGAGFAANDPVGSHARANASRFKRTTRVIARDVLGRLDDRMHLRREQGWYLEDAKRELEQMGATVSTTSLGGATASFSGTPTAAPGAAGTGETRLYFAAGGSRGKRSRSASFGRSRVLTITDAITPGGLAGSGSFGGGVSRGSTRLGTRAGNRRRPSAGLSWTQRKGTAGAPGTSSALALRPLTGALATRGAHRPSTVAFALEPWQGEAAARIGAPRSSSTASGESQALRPSQPLPLSWQLPSYLLPSIPQDQLVASTRVPVGYAVASECRPNDMGCFGRLVIRHEPLTAPVLPGRYTVSITGLSPGSYSISVVCSMAYAGHTVIDGAARTAVSIDGQIAEARSDLTDMVTAERLGSRKLALVQGMIAQSEESIAGLGQQVATLHSALENRSIVRADLGSDDEDEDDGGGASDDDGDEDGNAGRPQPATQQSAAPGANGELLTAAAANADAILNARRRRQRIAVSADIEVRISARLGKLDTLLLGQVRTLQTRRRELADVAEGLDQLAAARTARECDLEALVGRAKEISRCLPGIIEAVGVRDPAAPLTQAPVAGAPDGCVPSSSSSAATLPAAAAATARLLASGASPSMPGTFQPGPSAASASAASTLSLHMSLAPPTATSGSGGRRSDTPGTAATFARLPPRAGSSRSRRLATLLPYIVLAVPAPVLDYVRFGPHALMWKLCNCAERALELAPTPAGMVRRKPLGDLTADEREWVGLDRVLCPHHYDLCSDLEDPDAEIDALLAEGASASGSGGEPSADATDTGVNGGVGGASRLDRIVPRAHYTRAELVRIASVPIGQLTTTERRVRTLLSRYNDNITHPAAGSAAAAAAAPDGTATMTSPDGFPPPQGFPTPAPGTTPSMRVDPATGARVYDTAVEQRLDVLDRRARRFTTEARFHVGASPFSMARSAIPIPARAPAQLRSLLMQRGQRLATMWEAVRRDPRNAVEADVIAGARTISEDADERCRDLLYELDRAWACQRETLDSNVLHGREQRFAVSELRSSLELALDTVLVSQVKERELIEAAIIQQKVDARVAAAQRVAAAEAAGLSARRTAALKRMMLRETQRRSEWELDNASKGARALLTDHELHDRARKAEAMRHLHDDQEAKRRGSTLGGAAAAAASTAAAVAASSGSSATGSPPPDIYRGGEFAIDPRDPINELGALSLWGDPSKPATPRKLAAARAAVEAARLSERERLRAVRDVKDPDRQARLIAVWKRRRQKAYEKSAEGQAAAALAQLGSGGCLACMTAPCSWAPPVPVDAVKERLREVETELLRVRCSAEGSGSESSLLHSEVVLSFHRSGPPRLPRGDLVFQLAVEAAGLHDKLRLAELDKELHDVLCATGDSVTTVALHGHPQTAWKANAVTALKRQVAPLTARQVAESVVEDILEWMQEGWHFGEAPSAVPAAGYVPSLGLTGRIAKGLGGHAAVTAASSTAARAGQLGPAARAAASDASRGLRPLFACAGMGSGGPRALQLTESDSDGPTQAMTATSHLSALLPAGILHAPGQARRGHAASSSRKAAPLSGRTEAVTLRHALSAELATQSRFERLLNSDAQVAVDARGQLVPYLPGTSGAIVPAGSEGALALQQEQRQPSHPEATRVHDSTRWAAISNVAQAREVFRSALETQAAVSASLDDSEAVLRTGMFLIALHYFRLMNDLSKLKAMFEGQSSGVDATESSAAASAAMGKRGPDPASAAPLTSNPTIAAADRLTQEACADERERMNATERARLKRQAALALADARAIGGWAARATKLAEAAAAERKASAAKSRRRGCEQRAATDIQRTWRGFRTRAHFHEYVEALRHGETLTEQRGIAAVRVQALWRGHVARQFVADRRGELEAFLKFMREEERGDLIDAYYEANQARGAADAVKGFFARRKQGRAVAKVAKQRLLDDAVVRAKLGPSVLATAARTKANAERRGELISASDLTHEELYDGKDGALPELLRRGRHVTIGDRIMVADAVDDANAQQSAQDTGPLDLDALGDDAAFFGIRRPPPQPKRLAFPPVTGASPVDQLAAAHRASGATGPDHLPQRAAPGLPSITNDDMLAGRKRVATTTNRQRLMNN